MAQARELISVIIPCYNQARFLGEAIESVLAQTYPRVEIVVVDDGSTDNPAEVVRRYEGVRFVRRENGGPAAARNTGFRESTGDYLVFLDGDDRLLPDALEIGMQYLKNSPYAFVSGHCRYIAEDGSPLSTPVQPVVEEDHYLALLRRNYVWAGSTVLHRRSCLEAVNGYDPSPKAKGAEDFELYLRIARQFPVFCHGRTTAEYRQYNGSATNVSGDPGLMLGSTLFALSRQAKQVKGNAREEQAYRQGRANRRQLWGNLLFDRIKTELATRQQWRRAVQGILLLMRYDARGLLQRLTPRRSSSILLLLLLLVSASYARESNSNQPVARGEQKVEREVAVTFDDLPAVGPYDLRNIRAINKKLLDVIVTHKIPATGFVTGWNMGRNNEQIARVEILNQWLNNGLELGNHTFSHWDFHETSLAAFERDVVRNETLIKKLVEAKGSKLRYFRHPYLHTGSNQQKRQALEQFLAKRGYTIAPVTHDNQEWVFSIVYDRAWKRNDRAMMQNVGALYLDYMKALFDYYEDLSRQLFGREIKQVLLVHDNLLNADYFAALVRIMEERGYRFISLQQALSDPAYTSGNTYVGPLGPSWLQRWAITRGVKYQKEPQVPEYIQEQYEQAMRAINNRKGE